jgi:hypothetical protein
VDLCEVSGYLGKAKLTQGGVPSSVSQKDLVEENLEKSTAEQLGQF